MHGPSTFAHGAGCCFRFELRSSIDCRSGDSDSALAATVNGQIVAGIESTNFAGNKIGTSPVRKLVVDLPPGTRDRRSDIGGSFSAYSVKSYRAAFDRDGAAGLLDQ